MNTNNQIHAHTNSETNLIGETYHRYFIRLQAGFGFAQRGGVKYPYNGEAHEIRLVNDVNLLTSKENRQLVFSEAIFSN